MLDGVVVPLLSFIGLLGWVVLPGSVDERFMPGSVAGRVVDSGSVFDGVVVDEFGVMVEGEVRGVVPGWLAPGNVDGCTVLPGTVDGCVVLRCVPAGCVVAPGAVLDGEEAGVDV
ncbi:hypothetical protein [Dyadobacter sandarakinus]|uniref:NusG domain-containing protein n=1 Tax=Dyadobacter sandarakinus TaxID=2747268 RepID=A0ABX7I547_9BACT|nr:hypothetical protein [Dyadobacter sandarakinus]QRR00983.1 hypothetical protein HWI92_08760 [Dyadobacter sandarakinus]